MDAADVVFLGEVHDNPAHHRLQADLVRQIRPKAIVFEMLTTEQAGRVTPEIRGDAAALSKALMWAESGWPDFNLYHPIFIAAPEAAVYGAAVPRDAARSAMTLGVQSAFGPQAVRFGLDTPLPQAEQDRREQLQFDAHCQALPPELLPAMVDIQRLRDARLAEAVEEALAQTGGPVAVITGNGHARTDWGAPRFVRRVAPDAALFALGQTEDGAPISGVFDAVADAPSVARPDPCAAFRK